MARTADACIGCEGCVARSKMFVSIGMCIYQRSGYKLARLMASSESGGVWRWLLAHCAKARAFSLPLVPVAFEGTYSSRSAPGVKARSSRRRATVSAVRPCSRAYAFRAASNSPETSMFSVIGWFLFLFLLPA